jgi:hypothetical protein
LSVTSKKSSRSPTSSSDDYVQGSLVLLFVSLGSYCAPWADAEVAPSGANGYEALKTGPMRHWISDLEDRNSEGKLRHTAAGFLRER